MSSDLGDYLKAKREIVESHLQESLRACGDAPAALLEAMAYSLLAPGKRLRPLLVILSADACGGREKDALAAAAAVEMIHTYSLIHDDLPAMDDDDLRRGLPTCHKKFGEALAILAGDALLTLAFQVLSGGYPPKTAAGCCRELALGAGAAGMVGGQVEDLAWESSEKLGTSHDSEPSAGLLSVLESIHAYKTGALFRSCLRMGVWIASGERPEGPDRGLLEMMDNYGRCFGQAFQITDDVLDIEGSAAETGKRVQKDAGRGKLTYPRLLGVTESRERARRLCQDAANLLMPLGGAGTRLAELAQSIVLRTR